MNLFRTLFSQTIFFLKHKKQSSLTFFMEVHAWLQRCSPSSPGQGISEVFILVLSSSTWKKKNKKKISHVSQQIVISSGIAFSCNVFDQEKNTE